VPVTVRYLTDPACPWSWGAEPELRALLWEFGDELRVEWVMGGLARAIGPDYRDSEGAIGAGSDPLADLTAQWLEVAATTGMPIDPRLWSEAPIASTYPAGQAVKAASEQGPGPAGAYLRALREGLMVGRRKLDHVAALIDVAREAGLDVERFRIDLGSHAITEAFAADLDEVRDVPEPAREAGQVRTTEGRERVSLPSAVFVGEDGAREAVWGRPPAGALREAALAAGAMSQRPERPAPLQALEAFGRCATRELEVLSGLARPVLLAELWGAAREWRVRAEPALTGTLWELA